MAATAMFSLTLVIVCVAVIAKYTVIVPEGSAYVVERLGRYVRTIPSGICVLIPFFEVVRYRHSLKEQALPVPAQACSTKDNARAEIDGTVCVQVVDPERASYGVSDYRLAVTRLAQSELENRVAAIASDRLNAERGNIAAAVAGALDRSSAAWGIKVLRYEIAHIEQGRVASRRP